MAEKKINEALIALRKEISQLEVGDQSVKQRLDNLVENIETSLGSGDGEHPVLIEEMQEAITHFEVEHPRITGIINDIMITLNNLGI